jgi:hypothetical protein
VTCAPLRAGSDICTALSGFLSRAVNRRGAGQLPDCVWPGGYVLPSAGSRVLVTVRSRFLPILNLADQ